MGIITALLAIAVVFLVVSLIVTAVKWLSILALLFLVFAIAGGMRRNRQG